MDKILYPIQWVISWIMYACHKGLTFLGLSDGAGVAWVFSIVGLVIVMRILLIPLFFRQIRASRGMQIAQPEIQAIQKKYKGKTDPASREAMSRETMDVYKKHGTNPFSSCLPILLQSPIFFALFRMLNALPAISDGSQKALGPITQDVASDIEHSTVFGAELSEIFLKTESTQSKIVIACLIIAMSATTFFTQRQLTMKNMPQSALQGPMASTQKMMLYVFPFIFAVSGVNFPVGVLVYWTTTNLWSMGQQFYTIRRMPAPGSEAERRMKERKARRNKGGAADVVEDASVIEEPRGGQRQQPKRKNRQKGPSGKPSPVKDSTDDVQDEPTTSTEPASGDEGTPPKGTGAKKRKK